MSLKKIRKICIRKPACIFVYPFRNISTIITSFLVKTSITPTQVTVISLIFGIIAAISFAFGEYKYIILGAILLQISFILDLVDGEIARYKNLKSEFGGWLDTVSDYIMLYLVCVGITIGSFTQTNNPLILILGILSLLILASISLVSCLRGRDKKFKKSKSIKASKGFYVGIYAPTVILFTIGPLLKQVNIMFLIYMIIGFIILIKLFIVKYKIIIKIKYKE